MKTSPQWVTPSDYLNKFGEDLNRILRVTDNNSNKANLFLVEMEDLITNWIDANCFRNYRWEELLEPEVDALKLAILYQARYVAINGEIFMDSGYDVDRGIIAEKAKLQDIAVCDMSLNILKNSSLYSRSIKNRRRYVRIAKV